MRKDYICFFIQCGVGWWVVCWTRNLSVMTLNPITSSHYFLEQETLPLLLSTGWFQEQIWE